jgi:hypothetical protein
MSKEAAARRVIVPPEKYHSEVLSPGVVFQRFYPGGKDGPNGEVHYDKPGGQVWTDLVLLGDPDDPFQLMVPDIRMPANQYWPLHWHDTWTVVLVLDGGCVVGDWYMRPGDVFITEPSIEYGPLLIGPYGCRLLEIFAQAHLANGGYSPEFRDHPTLQGTDARFKERSALNKRNDGHQVLAIAGVVGMFKSRLEPGAEWDLGDSSDPDRGVMRDTRLSAGQKIPEHSYGDWHALLVLDGSIEISGRKVDKDGYLISQPASMVGEIQAGSAGAQLLELSRTSRGMDRRPASRPA